MTDSFATHDTLEVNGERFRYASLARLGRSSTSPACRIR